jgi:hypothetical protein
MQTPPDTLRGPGGVVLRLVICSPCRRPAAMWLGSLIKT